MPESPPGAANGGGAMMALQLAGAVKDIADRIKLLFDQPVIRLPYNLPLAASQVIPAGGTQIALSAADFSSSLEWPFEVHTLKFSQDEEHSFRDWRVLIQDQVFSQQLMKSSAMVSTLVKDNTGAWDLKFPWTIRAKGGGWSIFVNNLDPANPITVDLNLQGYLLIPRA